MYNINNYQNSDLYNSYYSQLHTPKNSLYNSNSYYSNISLNNLGSQINKSYNRVIKLYPSSQNQYSNFSNYSYLTKIPNQASIKNSLINNNFQQNKYVSKSQEPNIRLYKKRINNNNMNNITNVNLNITQHNYPLNIKINNIQKINRVIKIRPYKIIDSKIYSSRTPEPILRKKIKLKQKKIKTRVNNFNVRSFIPLNINDGQTKVSYNSNYVNKTEYLNIPKLEY